MGKHHKWYIEPINAFTNEVVSRNQDFLCDEQMFDGVLCADGKSHKLWGCAHGFSDVDKFMKSRACMGTVFKVWHQEGNGPIRVWIFTGRKKVKLPVPAKDISTK